MTDFTIGQIVSGADRTFVMNGKRYSIMQNPRPKDLPSRYSWNLWRYVLPDGESYTNKTQFGAMLMCLRHLGGDKWTEV